MLTVESSKEDVGNFMVENLKLKEDIKNILIKEDISGDVLLDLTEEELKSIGIKVIQVRKIKAYVDQNKNKFGEKKFTEIISVYSDSSEVAEFFRKSLNFNGDLNNLDGKGLLELNDESITNFGLTLGQRKKLVKYISYFKTLKVEPPKELVLTKESKPEEVIDFFKKRFKFSDEGIKSLEELGMEGGLLIKGMFLNDAVHLLLHGLYLLVGKVLQSVLEIPLDFELDELSVTLWVTADVPIQNLVVCEL